jgi:hypothetical protein
VDFRHGVKNHIRWLLAEESIIPNFYARFRTISVQIKC